jgi:hypothetical protein
VARALYHIINSVKEIPKCNCGKERKFRDVNNGYSLTCGEKVCRYELTSQTYLKKYGDHPMRTLEVNEKRKKTLVQKYGVEHTFQSELVKDQIRATYNEKYGVDHYSQHSSHREKIRSSSKFRTKTYALPSGRAISIQGYENWALDEILLSYDERDICCTASEIEKEIGKIFYRTEDDKMHRYFPDLYIKSANRVVEVKSTWTWEKNPTINEKKREACIDNGRSFEYMIYDSSGKRIVYEK